MWIRKHGPERILNFTRWIGSVDEENIKGAGGRQNERGESQHRGGRR